MPIKMLTFLWPCIARLTGRKLMQFSVQEEVVILAEANGCSGLFDIKSCYPFLKHSLNLFCAGNVSVSVHSLTAFLYTTLFSDIGSLGSHRGWKFSLFQFRFTCLANRCRLEICPLESPGICILMQFLPLSFSQGVCTW